MIQQLAPLLGLGATSLDLTEAEYNQLMSRKTFVTIPPTLQLQMDIQDRGPDTAVLELSDLVELLELPRYFINYNPDFCEQWLLSQETNGGQSVF